jgi:MFS transporter, FSR family, fosmidomycin resistance protein
MTLHWRVRWTTALLSVGHGINDAYTAILPALLPLLQVRFGLTQTLVALLVAASLFSSSFPAPFLGVASDRFGSRLLTALGIGATAVLLSLIGLASNTSLLFMVVILGGLGSAALHPAGSTLVRASPTSSGEVSVAAFSAGGMIGYALGPVVVILIVGRMGIESTAWLAIPGLLVAVVVYALLPAEDRTSGKSRPMQRIDAGLLSGPVGLLTVAGTFAYLPFHAFVSGLPLWLVHVRGLSPTDPLLGLTLTAFSLAAAAGGVIGGILSIRVPREIVVPALMLLALGPLFIVFKTEPGSGAYLVAVVIAGVFTYGSGPLLVVIAQNLAPQAAAAASGMLIGVSAGVAALLYVGIGWLQDVIGIGPALAVAYLAMIPAAGIAFWVLQAHPAPGAPLTSKAVQEITRACLSSGTLGRVPGTQIQPN